MSYIKHIVDYAKNSYVILKNGYIFLWRQYTYILFLTLLKVKPVSLTTKVTIGGDVIVVQNNFVSFLVIQEIFIEQLYKRLHSLQHVLDLGGYIGDSAIYLSKINTKVTVLESDPRNFAICETNTQNLANVVIYNAAVTGSEQKRYIVNNNEYRGEISHNAHENSQEIPTMSIKELEKQGFDGLKMDIEGGEYDLIAYWLESGSFDYKKGFIEFHFFKKEKEKQFDATYAFIQLLATAGYMFEFFGNDGKIVSTVDTVKKIYSHTLPYEYINIYFEK